MKNSTEISRVSVVTPGSELSPEQISDEIARVLNLAGGLSKLIKSGDTVLVKPNLVALPPDDIRGAITNPFVTKAVADQVLALGGNVIIGDSSAVGVSTEDVIATTDYQYLRELGYCVKDLKQDSVVKIPVPQAKEIENMPVFKTAAEADLIISVPVMKTHDQVEVSLSIKNLKGILPDHTKKAFHNKYGLPHAVSDLLSAVPNTFAVVDALYALEGMGPVYGDSVPMGMLFAGKDLVAVDSIASHAMGVKESELIIEKEANSRGLGNLSKNEIEIKGDYQGFQSGRRQFFRIKDYQFQFEGVDFQLKFNNDACTGCKNTVLSSLDDISQADAQDELEGKCVLAGPQEFNQKPECELVLIGNCLKNYQDTGVFVPGCPPENHPVIEAMVGKGKVGKRYSSQKPDESESAETIDNGVQTLNCVKGIIFDLDNTLINSKIDFQKMKELVIEYLQSEDLLDKVSQEEHTTATVVEEVRSNRSFNSEQESRVWEIISSVEAEGMEKAEIEPGVRKLLSKLAGKYNLVVLTNNSYKAAKTALQNFGLDKYFDMVVAREQMESLKPSPSGLEVILNNYPDISNREWVMIGDSWIDAEASRRSGVPFMAYNCKLAELKNRNIPYQISLTNTLEILDYI